MPRTFDYLTHGLAPGLRPPRFAESGTKIETPSTTTRVIQINNRGTTARRGALRRRNAWTSQPCDKEAPHYIEDRAPARTSSHLSQCSGHSSCHYCRAQLSRQIRGTSAASPISNRVACVFSARLVGNEIAHCLRRLTAHGIRYDAPAHYCRAPSIADRTA